MTPLRLGALSVDPPVVLAPMAGVTNAPFRRLCRSYGGGLFVSEMVLAQALVHRNAKTEQMASFAPGEWPRSLQVYGTDPVTVGRAVARLVGEDRVDHVDLNFGCPMPKVTRVGGGAAVPARPRLLGAIVAAAVGAAGPVPVTVKMRTGIDGDRLTFRTAGLVAEAEGAAAVALHARTAEQRYAGRADWRAIAELKAAVSSVPVLGNGDIRTAADAVAMMAATGCDGVVVGRGCLGRPWLFRDLALALAGEAVPPTPRLGAVTAVLRCHAELLVDWFGERKGCIELRKHAGWYLTGYPVGATVRRRLGMVGSLDELDTVLAGLDPSVTAEPGAETLPRGHSGGARPVVLPDGWCTDPDDPRPFRAGPDALVSGG